MNYKFRPRQLELNDSYDVIVAGVTAAVAAAREGRRTLLIEATGALGGMGTVGLVPCWCQLYDFEKSYIADLRSAFLTGLSL